MHNGKEAEKLPSVASPHWRTIKEALVGYYGKAALVESCADEFII